MKRPPRLATALLERSVAPSVTGDLIERYRGGHSRAWYWRQVIAALCRSVVRDIRTHPVRVLAAAAAGYAALWVGSEITLRAVDLDQRLFERGFGWLYMTGLFAWVKFWPALALWKSLAYAMAGWIASRVSPQRACSALALLVIIVCAVNVEILRQQLLWPYRSMTIAQILVDLFLLYPLATLVGGVWGMFNTSNAGGSLA